MGALNSANFWICHRSIYVYIIKYVEHHQSTYYYYHYYYYYATCGSECKIALLNLFKSKLPTKNGSRSTFLVSGFSYAKPLLILLLYVIHTEISLWECHAKSIMRCLLIGSGCRHALKSKLFNICMTQAALPVNKGTAFISSFFSLFIIKHRENNNNNNNSDLIS